MNIDLDNVAECIMTLLNENSAKIVPSQSLNSPRAVGDNVQEYLAEEGLEQALKRIGIANVQNDFTRRSMEDIAFSDEQGNYYAVDVKTHNINTQFNRPNLISVQRLAKFYKNDTNTFCILIVSYTVENKTIKFTDCKFKPIEDFSWKGCLTLGALGWGQIQIYDANKLAFNSPAIGRKRWMLELCDTLDKFYDEEIGKINERKLWFSNIRSYWEKHM